MSLYLKIGLIAAAILAIVLGVHFYDQHLIHAGEDKCSEPKAIGDLTAYKAQQAEIDRLRTVVATYEKTAPDPIVAGLAHRVYVYQACADRLSEAPTHAASPSGTGGVPAGDPESERLLDQALQAASRDSQRLSFAQKAWPQ